MRIRPRSRLTAALLVGVLGLLASLAASARAAKSDAITLSVWDYSQDDKALVTVINAFEKAHPNIKVDLNLSKGFDDYNTTLKLGLSGPDAPDLAVGNQGWSADGTLVKAHLVVPLDKYAKKYGWNTRFGNLDEFKWTADGKHWGTGHLYAITHWAGPYGIYVHTKALKKLGLKIPTNLAQLQSAMAAAKKAGITPMVYGAVDKWPASQELGMVMNMLAPGKKLNDWIFGRNNVTFQSLNAVKAATILQKWANAGYFTKDFNGVTYQDATTRFGKGEGLFMFTGSWMVPSFEGKGIQFFTLPSSQAMATQGEGWHLTAKSKHPDEAAMLLDWMTNPQSERTFVKVAKFIPSAKMTAKTGRPLFDQSMKIWERLNDGGTQIKLLEWSTPDMANTMDGGIQELMVGRKTPQQFVQDVQSTYDKFQKSNR
jgi:raffinose/stachyose/melibiose transport system substrate-binding protein